MLGLSETVVTQPQSVCQLDERYGYPLGLAFHAASCQLVQAPALCLPEQGPPAVLQWMTGWQAARMCVSSSYQRATQARCVLLGKPAQS